MRKGPPNAPLELERLPATISVVEEADGRECLYTSVVPRFIRERYILVEAIVIITILGPWNICVAEACKVDILLVATKNARGLLPLVVLPE